MNENSTRDDTTIRIITPVYNDRDAVCRLLAELAPLHASHGPLRVTIVDDGSLLAPVTAQDVTGHPFEVEILSLFRNVGHQRAIAIGMVHAVQRGGTGPVVVMDGDGEDSPEAIAGLLERLEDDALEVVVAQRGQRSESLSFRGFYQIYRGLFRMLTGQEIRFGNFSAMSASAAQRLIHMDDLWMHVPAAILRSGLPRGAVEVDRGHRYDGSSRMNLVSLVTHGLRSVAVFTESVLTRILLFCAAIAIPSLVLIVLALLIKLTGYATPGWLTSAIGALLGLIIQTATIAMVSLLIAINGRNNTSLTPKRIAPDLISGTVIVPASKA